MIDMSAFTFKALQERLDAIMAYRETLDDKTARRWLNANAREIDAFLQAYDRARLYHEGDL